MSKTGTRTRAPNGNSVDLKKCPECGLEFNGIAIKRFCSERCRRREWRRTRPWCKSVQNARYGAKNRERLREDRRAYNQKYYQNRLDPDGFWKCGCKPGLILCEKHTPKPVEERLETKRRIALSIVTELARELRDQEHLNPQQSHIAAQRLSRYDRYWLRMGEPIVAGRPDNSDRKWPRFLWYSIVVLPVGCPLVSSVALVKLRKRIDGRDRTIWIEKQQPGDVVRVPDRMRSRPRFAPLDVTDAARCREYEKKNRVKRREREREKYTNSPSEKERRRLRLWVKANPEKYRARKNRWQNSPEGKEKRRAQQIRYKLKYPDLAQNRRAKQTAALEVLNELETTTKRMEKEFGL